MVRYAVANAPYVSVQKSNSSPIVVLYTIIKDTEITTYTFDKVKNSILWERENRFKILQTKSVEFPCHIISGIEDSDRAAIARVMTALVSWNY
ncbi:MAG: hypothetical protein V7K97_01685 [Nostoc sp.]|uniref:hypothetical protein n=1 Tax=Nostoc sp. TaxID=1180 RepID=UPI002FF8BC9B